MQPWLGKARTARRVAAWADAVTLVGRVPDERLLRRARAWPRGYPAASSGLPSRQPRTPAPYRLVRLR